MKKNLRLSKGRKVENDVIDVLTEKFFGFSFNRYSVFDNAGNEVPQTVLIRGKRVRHPDINVVDFFTKNNELILRIEIKSFSSFYKNNVPDILTDNDFLVIEKEAFDDYIYLQNSGEIECKILLVVGSSEYLFYWDTLDNLKNKICYSGWFSPFQTDCYFWFPNDLNSGIDNLVED